MPIVPIFLVLCLVIFGVAVILMQPSSDEKAFRKRIAAVKSPAGVFGPETENLQHYLKTLERGSFGWLEDLVEGSAFQRSLLLLIIQANRTTCVGTVMMTCSVLILATLGIAYLVTGSILVAGAAALGAAFLPIVVMRIQRNRRIAKFNTALPDCIDLMARSLRAGHAMMAALNIVAAEAVEPAKTEFSEVCKKQNYGLPMRDALMQLLDRMPSQDLRVLVTGMLVQKDTGGNLVEILDRILFVVRERNRLQGEIRTHTAQGRLTGWILCALPIIMLGLINIINPGYSSVLFNEPFGRKLLYAGLILLTVGGLMIRKIVNGIEA
jgi:tight adherence protein B